MSDEARDLAARYRKVQRDQTMRGHRCDYRAAMEAQIQSDAADPRLALWGEIVEALERIRVHPNAHFNVAAAKWGAPTIAEIVDGILARTRAIDATNQGGDATLSDRGET